ncbi:MAG TPA: amino acid adenylation domain-containing protein [Pyrinomonadaceae bacterium]|nr:amino acid adenylation domain-containing protein [Pyrinomonadaceae bacterium]
MTDLLSQVSALSPAKRALLEKMLLAQQGRESAAQVIKRRQKTDEAGPLSFAQERLWILDQLAPGNPFYNINSSVRLSGWLRTAALAQSLNELLRRHEVLRARIVEVDGRPVQQIASELDLQLPLVDLSCLSETEREIVAEQITAQQVGRGFDLAGGGLLRTVLLRLETNEHRFISTIHHIVSDGWSMTVFVSEIGKLYQAYEAGDLSALAELPVQYGDYAVWQREWLSGQVLAEQVNYWKQQMAGAPAVLELPTDRVRGGVQSYRGGSERLELSGKLRAQLEDLSRREGVTLFMTLLAAWQVLVHRYSDQRDVVVGTPIAGRTRAEVEGLIGFFANTLVLRTEISGELSFRDLLKRVKQVCLGAYSNQDLPFEKLVEELQPQRSLSHNPLVQVVFGLRDAISPGMELPGLTMTPHELAGNTAKFDLTIDVEKTDTALKCSAEYNADLFDPARITRMLRHFAHLLHGVVANVDQPVSHLPLLSEAEYCELSVAWQASRRDFNLHESVHELFERQVQLSPDTVAVNFGDEQLTYRELNERANQLARYLLSLGVGPDSLVALALDRSLEMMIGLFGTLKAGAGYLPLDPDYPQSRLEYMMADSQAHILLTHEHLLERMPLDRDHQVVCLDRDWQIIAQHESTDLNTPIDAEQLAYVIYTSGSTGGPKGVMISHGSLTNLLDSMLEQPAIDVSDRMLATTTLSFDIAAVEMYLPLIAGACIELVSRDELLAPARLRQQMKHNTIMQGTPSLWRTLVESGDWNEPGKYRVQCAGEPMSRQLAKQLVERADAVWNMYGPTETTIYSSIEQVFGDAEGQYESIGRAIANTQLYILDRWLQPVPRGIGGELFIGGAGVARGYLRRPELTAERFIPDRFTETPGARCYNSGDLARYLEDGRVEYVGRADHQVKVRGHRIELREIESALTEHEQVVAAAVVVRETENGDKQLVAYVVAEEEMNAAELRGFLKERLPDYMAPSFFTTLDELPLTANGKIDRRQLMELAQQTPQQQNANEYVAPRTATEDVLAGLWSEVLGIERVGVNDDFFTLGGHSLLATQLLSRVQKIFRVDLPLRKLFETPTVLGLADALALAYGDADAIEDIAQMVRQLREMSDEDIKQMMAVSS